jgi:hypothetical protein
MATALLAEFITGMRRLCSNHDTQARSAQLGRLVRIAIAQHIQSWQCTVQGWLQSASEERTARPPASDCDCATASAQPLRAGCCGPAF